MTRTTVLTMLALLTLLPVERAAAGPPAKSRSAGGRQADIERALSAAPPAIARGAAVADMADDGRMTDG